MKWKASLRVVIGSIALGFLVFLILASLSAALSPEEKFPIVMRNGGYIWFVLAILASPISWQLFRGANRGPSQ